MNRLLLLAVIAVLFSACSQKKSVDLLVHNARIYTVDSAFSVQEAMVIKDGKVVATGSYADLLASYTPSDSLNADGKTIIPGFIDAHAHFVGYAQGLQTVDLTAAPTWDNCIERAMAFASTKNLAVGQWITGRGWDQNLWPGKKFPDNEALNLIFSNNPVLLVRVDGHAAIANNKALELAGIKPGDKIEGGEIEVVNGKLTGVLVDNAIQLVSSKIPVTTDSHYKTALQQAEKNCFAMGLTSIADCGLSKDDVEKIKQLHSSNALAMRLYVLLSDDKPNYDYLEKSGIIKTDRLHVRGFKVYGDGALGSRGACLLSPYHDRPGHLGFLLSSAAHFDSVATRIKAGGFQMCTHAIGDSGNRVILNTYAKHLPEQNDLRWRIEHAQVVAPADFALFGKYKIVPSVQPTHATSDMYWAADRLGNERVKTAYAYKQLLQQNGWLALGTDFPVEDISPFKTFFASVVRKDSKNWPEQGFQTENALSREETLKGMTIWAAKSHFEEKEKGSLEAGKLADFIILNKDLMTIPESEILTTTVQQTYINGVRVYKQP